MTGSWKAKGQSALLIVVCLASLLPFLDKAVHIDDPVYLWVAQRIHESPTDFYGFSVNWYGHETPMAETNKNPPLVSFYLALAALLGGWSETWLHGAMLLPALALILGIYSLARRLCGQPLLAALSAWAMPAVLVSATSLMGDVLMLALWCWAVVLWIRGTDAGSIRGLVAGAGLASLAVLTEFFALSLVPLLLVYSLLRGQRSLTRLSVLLIPIGVLFVYELWIRAKYGVPVLTDLFAYAGSARAATARSGAERGLVGLIFLGGALLTPLFFAPWLWSRRTLGFGAIAALAVGGMFFLAGDVAGEPLRSELGMRWGFLAQAVLFAAAGVQILALAGRDFQKRRNPDSTLLVLWILGVFLFAAFVNWTTSARAVLPAAPAVAILLWRRIGERRAEAEASSFRLASLLVPALAVSLLVAWGDYRLANSARSAAAALTDRYASSGRTLRFQGGWGFQYYMEARNGKKIDLADTAFESGDIAIVPWSNTNVAPLPGSLRRIRTAEFPAAKGVSTLSSATGAGFYSDRWGPLPFVLGPAPPELYSIYRAEDAFHIGAETERSDGVEEEGPGA